MKKSWVLMDVAQCLMNDCEYRKDAERITEVLRES